MLAIEVPVIAAGIWSTGAAFFYGSQYIGKVEVWLNQPETILAKYRHTEVKEFADVVATIAIKPSNESKTSTSIITSDGGTTSTFQETIPRKTGRCPVKPTALPKVSVLVGDTWLELRKNPKDHMTTREKEIKSPSPFSKSERKTLKKAPAIWAEEVRYVRVKILHFFTTIGNFFPGNLVHNLERLRYASSTILATAPPHNSGSNNTSWHSWISKISNCNISSIFEAYWSASQLIYSQLSVVTVDIAAPFIWTATRITIPLLRWFIFDIVCPPPRAAFRYTSDCLALISKWSSQIWFIYKKSDTVLFLIGMVFIIIGCGFYCCFENVLIDEKDDNNNTSGDETHGTCETSYGFDTYDVTSPSPLSSTGNISRNNTFSGVTPKLGRGITNLSRPTDTERDRLHLKTEAGAVCDEEEQNRVYRGEKDGTAKTPRITTPIAPIEGSNRATNDTEIRDLMYTYPGSVSRRPIPDPIPNETPKERAARLERLVARMKIENEELPQRLRDEGEKRYQEGLQKKQFNLRKRQNEEEARVQEARNQSRSKTEKFLALPEGKIENTTLQQATMIAKNSPSEAKTLTTEGGNIKTTIFEAPVRQPTITTDSLVQRPNATDPRPHVRRSHHETSLNKNSQKTDGNGIPFVDIPGVQQLASQIANDRTGFRLIEDPFKKNRKSLRIFEINEKKGLVTDARSQSPLQPNFEGFTQSITPEPNHPVIGGLNDNKDGGADINLGGGSSITDVIDTNVILGRYPAASTGLVTSEGPSISVKHSTSPGDTEPLQNIPSALVNNALRNALPMPRFKKSRSKGSGRQRTPRISENASKANKMVSTSLDEPYDSTRHGLSNSSQLATTKTVEPYEPRLPPVLPVDQSDPTKPGLVHGPSIQEPGQPRIPGLSQTNIQGLIQSQSGGVLMEDAPPVPTALSTSPAPLAIDDGEEMIIDDENEKPYRDDRDFDMGEADDPPTRCGVSQPLLGVFGSSFKTDEPAPQQPSNTIENGPQLDDVDMDEVTTDVTMCDGSSQPIPFGTVLAPVRPNPIDIVPAPLRADTFGNFTTPQPIPFSVVAAPDPITIVPAPPRHDQFGTLSTQWTSMTSMNNSFSGGEPVGAPVGNNIGRGEPIQTPIICRFGGDQSTHASTISDSGGHPTQAPTNNAFGESQHLKGTTVTHGPSIRPFSTTSLSNPGTSSHILDGPNNPSNSGSLMPSQKAKIMTQMLNYAKGGSGSVSATAVSGRSSINPGTDIFPSATPTALHDSSSSNVFDIISPPALVRPRSGSTAQKSSNIESKVTPIRGTSTGSMEVAHDLLNDAEKVEKAEKANRRDKAKREKERLVPPTPRERLIPKVRALNTRLIQKDDFAKSGKADTSAKRDSSPNRSKTFVVPGPSVPLEETDEDR
jgi:hypothetical protein